MIIFVEELILKFIVWCLKTIDNLRKSTEAQIEQLRKTIDELNIPKDIDVDLEKNKLFGKLFA